MFYANLRIKKDPHMFSLVKGTIITLGEVKLGEILSISITGPRVFGKSLGWSKSEALAMLLGVGIDEVYKK